MHNKNSHTGKHINCKMLIFAHQNTVLMSTLLIWKQKKKTDGCSNILTNYDNKDWTNKKKEL